MNGGPVVEKECLLCGIQQDRAQSRICSADAARHGVQLVDWAQDALHFWVDPVPRYAPYMGRGVTEMLADMREQVRDIIAGREKTDLPLNIKEEGK